MSDLMKNNNQWSASEPLEKKDRCWDGYKPVPGKKKEEKGSCEPVAKMGAEMNMDANVDMGMDKKDIEVAPEGSRNRESYKEEFEDKDKKKDKKKKDLKKSEEEVLDDIKARLEAAKEQILSKASMNHMAHQAAQDMDKADHEDKKEDEKLIEEKIDEHEKEKHSAKGHKEEHKKMGLKKTFFGDLDKAVREPQVGPSDTHDYPEADAGTKPKKYQGGDPRHLDTKGKFTRAGNKRESYNFNDPKEGVTSGRSNLADAKRQLKNIPKGSAREFDMEKTFFGDLDKADGDNMKPQKAKLQGGGKQTQWGTSSWVKESDYYNKKNKTQPVTVHGKDSKLAQELNLRESAKDKKD